MKNLLKIFAPFILTSLLYADTKVSEQIQVVGFDDQEKAKMVEKKLHGLREQKDLLGLIQLLNKYRLKLDRAMSSDKLLVYKVREYSKLYTAVLDDDIDALKKALKEDKSNIDEVYHDTYTALITASFHGQDEIVKLLLDAGATAGESAIEKHSFAKAFMVYTINYKNPNRLYTYSKFVISQLKDTKDLKVEDDLIYIYANFYELSINTGNSLSKEELNEFVKLSQKYPKAKAYLEMFYIIEESKDPNVLPTTLAKSTKQWQKNYAHLIKNKWSFDALKQWAKSLDRHIKANVTDVLTTLDDAVNR
jgi:xylose isomerase